MGMNNLVFEIALRITNSLTASRSDMDVFERSGFLDYEDRSSSVFMWSGHCIRRYLGSKVQALQRRSSASTIYLQCQRMLRCT